MDRNGNRKPDTAAVRNQCCGPRQYGDLHVGYSRPASFSARGEAQNASMRGTSPYSGKSVASAFDSNATAQETLVTLAGDTGGRAFLDSNDFGRVFTSVQQDTSVYYCSDITARMRHGRAFRRITVRVNRPGVKIDFRPRLLRSSGFPALHARRSRTPAG